METKYVYKFVYRRVRLLDNDYDDLIESVVVRFHVKYLEKALSDKVRYLPANAFAVTITPYDEFTEIRDSSIELFEDEIFVLRFLTLSGEELTSFRTTLPLEV